MKNKNIIALITGLLVLLLVILSCEPKVYDTDSFDVKYPTPTITGFTPATDSVEKTIVISGSGFDDYSVVKIGNVQIDSLHLLEVTASTITIKIPRVTLPGYLSVENGLKQDVTSGDMFTPIYNDVDITDFPDTLFLTQPYVIKGSNMDFISFVLIDDTLLTISNTNQSQLTLQPSGINFKKDIVSISFTQKNKKALPAQPVVILDDYPTANILFIEPDTISKGDLIKIVVDNWDNTKYISKIELPKTINVSLGRVTAWTKATFFLEEPYIYATIPLDAIRGDVRITNSYGVQEILLLTLVP